MTKEKDYQSEKTYSAYVPGQKKKSATIPVQQTKPKPSSEKSSSKK